MRLRSVAATLALTAVGGSAAVPVAAPAGAVVLEADDQAASPVPEAGASALAAQVTLLGEEITSLEQRVGLLQDRLRITEQEVMAASEGVPESTRLASALQAAAHRQALAAYIAGDPTTNALAVAAAVATGDADEVAYALGLVRATQRRMVDLARRAREAQPRAQSALVAAISDREAVQAELGRLDALIADARQRLTQARLDYEAYVLRLGPTTVQGLTTTAYEAYRRSAAALAIEQPSCGLRWELLAAIGKTESNHGAGRIDSLGNALPPIIGIPIGHDTDAGSLDLDPARDHAVGPMQFIPSTWVAYGADGDGNGVADPNNIWDATLAAGRYLCRAAGALTLRTREGVIRAILAYNPNDEYLRVVGARFEALASDLAKDWFSTGDLPRPRNPVPIPPPIGGGPPVTPPDRPPAPPDDPPPPSPTEVRSLRLWRPEGPAVPTDGPVLAGTCTTASAALAGRTGWVTCLIGEPGTGISTEVLDPCQPWPTDPTLVACVGDPERPARLVRTSEPVPVADVREGPPFLTLILAGGDRCLPPRSSGRAARPAAPPSSVAPPTTPSTTVASTAAPDPSTSEPTVSTTAAGSTSSATTAPAATTTAAATTTTATMAATTTSAITTVVTVLANLGASIDPATATTLASSAATTGSPAPSTTAPASTVPTTATPTTMPPTAAPPTTAPPTTAPPTTAPPTTAPASPGPATVAYECVSGATIAEQPTATGPVWTVTVHQSGLAPRTVPVLVAIA